MTKIAGPGSGSICQRSGSADPDPDPDPQQNVMDPQHWFALNMTGVAEWVLNVELQQCVKHTTKLRYDPPYPHHTNM
jgi:hypothetical protein